jgi:hypothetical protein
MPLLPSLWKFLLQNKNKKVMLCYVIWMFARGPHPFK